MISVFELLFIKQISLQKFNKPAPMDVVGSLLEEIENSKSNWGK
jgi:hypothetical protein